MTVLPTTPAPPIPTPSLDLSAQQHTAAVWFCVVLLTVGALILVGSYWPEIKAWWAWVWDNPSENDR